MGQLGKFPHGGPNLGHLCKAIGGEQLAKKKAAQKSKATHEVTPANPLALTLGQLADLLSKAAKQTVTEKSIQGDVDRGAPTNGDGTINLVNYTAWLASQVE